MAIRPGIDASAVATKGFPDAVGRLPMTKHLPDFESCDDCVRRFPSRAGILAGTLLPRPKCRIHCAATGHSPRNRRRKQGENAAHLQPYAPAGKPGPGPFPELAKVILRSWHTTEEDVRAFGAAVTEVVAPRARAAPSPAR